MTLILYKPEQDRIVLWQIRAELRIHQYDEGALVLGLGFYAHSDCDVIEGIDITSWIDGGWELIGEL